MAETTLRVGDPVLFLGHDLAVVALEEKGGDEAPVRIAVVENVGDREKREAAVQQERELRARPWKELARPGREAELEQHWKEVEAARQAASEALFVLRLRADLLSWWPDRGVWVSDGRILSDAQLEEWTRRTGAKKPAPGMQRMVLDFLDPIQEG